MLMEDLGDITLANTSDPEPWRAVMGALARIQKEFAANTAELVRLGLKQRTTGAVRSQIRRWVVDPSSIDMEYSRDRTTTELRLLEPHLDLVDELCDRIDSIGLPQTLDHGDLDGGNIFVTDGRPVIMDWSDASISSPLFATALIPQVVRDPELADPFLCEWTDFASLDRLRAGLRAAIPIAALERAMHYHANIVPYLARPSVDLRTLETYIPELLALAAGALEQMGG